MIQRPADITYKIQTKDGPRSKWRDLRFVKPMTLEEAQAFVADLDEQGNTARFTALDAQPDRLAEALGSCRPASERMT